MPKRKQRRREPLSVTEYADSEGNVVVLRDRLSPRSVAKIGEPPGSAAASVDDAWQRREEMLFERLAVRWTIAGLPIEEQRTLLARYRMASGPERRWIRETINRHIAEKIPELS